MKFITISVVTLVLAGADVERIVEHVDWRGSSPRTGTRAAWTTLG